MPTDIGYGQFHAFAIVRLHMLIETVFTFGSFIII